MSFFDDVKWESLTPAMQGAMVDLLNGVHKKSLPFGLISRELADIVDGDFIITPKGRVVYEAGNPPAAPDSNIPQPLADLAAARERIRELEAAVYLVINDYAVVNIEISNDTPIPIALGRLRKLKEVYDRKDSDYP